MYLCRQHSVQGTLFPKITVTLAEEFIKNSFAHVSTCADKQTKVSYIYNGVITMSTRQTEDIILTMNYVIIKPVPLWPWLGLNT